MGGKQNSSTFKVFQGAYEPWHSAQVVTSGDYIKIGFTLQLLRGEVSPILCDMREVGHTMIFVRGIIKKIYIYIYMHIYLLYLT